MLRKIIEAACVTVRNDGSREAAVLPSIPSSEIGIVTVSDCFGIAFTSITFVCTTQLIRRGCKGTHTGMQGDARGMPF